MMPHALARAQSNTDVFPSRRGKSLVVAVAVLVGWVGSAVAQSCPQTLCSGTTCTVGGNTLLSNGCVLNWPGRDVTIGGSAVLRQNVAGGSFTIIAGKLTVLGTLRSETTAGHITINTTDTTSVKTSGKIDAGLNGVLAINPAAGFSVENQGWVRGQGDEASLTVESAGAISVTSDPSDGPAISIYDITMTGSTITVGVSGSATSTISAGKDATTPTEFEGGSVDLTAESGPITVYDVIRAVGQGPDSSGGGISLDAQSVSVAANGVLNASASGTDATGGDVSIYVFGNAPLDVAGEINVEGNGSDGTIELGSSPGPDPLSALPACSITVSGKLFARSGTDADGGIRLVYRGTANWQGATLRTDTFDPAFGGSGGILVWCRDANRDGSCDSLPQGTPASINQTPIYTGAPYGGCSGCGNGEPEGAEACDDGNMNYCDGCHPTTCAVTTGCNDGNVCTNDSCNIVTGCQFVPNTAACSDGNACTTGDHCAGGSCVATPRCPNGVVDPSCGEQCDDNNFNNLDGCKNNCQLPYCGDNLVSNGEQCDDGNAVSNDGCSATCLREAQYSGMMGPTQFGLANNYGEWVTSFNGAAVVSDIGGFGVGPGPDAGEIYVYDANGALYRIGFVPEHTGGGQDFPDQFGYSATQYGNHILVGGPTLLGVYGFVALYSPSANAVQLIIDDPNPGPGIPPGNRFGSAVANCNNYIVVGSPYDDSVGADAGVVRVFNGFGQPAAVLSAPSLATSGRRMGSALAAAGTEVLVGMPGWNGNRGAAARMNVTTGAIAAQYFANPQLANGLFGSAVAMWGTNAVIGAPGHRAVFIYGPTGALLRTITVPQATTSFGAAVAVLGSQVLVGDPADSTRGTSAGAVHLFDGTNGQLIQTFLQPLTGGSRFGAAIAPLTPGVKFVVGAPGNGSSGGAYIVSRVCGNGVVDAGELCDDGNAVNGDCCSSNCNDCDEGLSCNGCGGTCQMSAGNCLCQ
jgi:cysteine-rich repeat protein